MSRIKQQNNINQSLESKKQTLEKFAYCNSSQLFQNQTFDLRSFIKINYELYCQLLDKYDALKSSNEQKQTYIHQLKEKQLKASIPQQQQDVDCLKKQLEMKQSQNNELNGQLKMLESQNKKIDFFEEYQDICKQVNELRVLNAQLLKR